MKLCYLASSYSSHARVAASYRTILAAIVEMVERPERADVVIIHDEPHLYSQYFARYPFLRQRYVVAYAVWEASILPSEYIKGISLVQEVWTCSHYCHDIFSRYHPHVEVVPHIAEGDDVYSADDAAHIDRLLQRSPKHVYFLTIGRLWDRRKNILGVIRSFGSMRSKNPNARLIVKTLPDDDYDLLRAEDERLIVITETLTERQMNALYAATDVFVSAHRSEGWGLCISDALVRGCLVVATDYAGPREYLFENNSILLPYKVVNVASTETYGLFDPSMQWAEPDLERLAEVFNETGAAPQSKEYMDKRAVARAVREKFSTACVEEILSSRAASLAAKVSWSHRIRRYMLNY